MNPGGWTRAAVPTTNITDQSARVQTIQARVVQHHYVRAELREINIRKGDALVEATLAALKQTPQGRKCDRVQLLHGFHTMTSRLQLADLTINIKAAKWFMTPNNYSSYTQMYERAVRPLKVPGRPVHQMRLTNGDANNPTHLRVAADAKATFRNEMMTGGRFAPQFGGIGRVMNPGNLAAPTVDAQEGELEASNPYFNPRSKQVFAALNYGRRPHGSTVTYGHSYLVLNPKFKTNAIYFAGDTFGNTAPDCGMNVSANDQISYDLLGAIYAKASHHLRQNIYKSCILNATLPDAIPSEELQLLLEAHLFEPLYFSGNIQKVVISETPEVGQPQPTPQEWQNIQINARAFASKHGARLAFVD